MLLTVCQCDLATTQLQEVFLADIPPQLTRMKSMLQQHTERHRQRLAGPDHCQPRHAVKHVFVPAS